jgi:hypothetical protein
MKDLSQLLTSHRFPSALDRIRRSFARQPDCQTCGAAAIRHGLLLGGLTIPTATLEAILGIRDHEGTSPLALRTCLRRLGLEASLLRKPARQPTAAFLDRLEGEFARGAFLIPCVRGAEHWVCVGAWHAGRVGLVDSFFDRRRPGGEPGLPLVPGLGFFSLSVEEFDALDWPHYVTLVRPGLWERQYRAWAVARPALLRLSVPRLADGRPITVVGAIRLGAHQFLDDEDYCYRRLRLCLPSGPAVTIRTEDPGGDAVGVEALGRGNDEVVVVRRLGGVLSGLPAVPELVLRAVGLRAGQLE